MNHIDRGGTWWLANDDASQPTHFTKLVPSVLNLLGVFNAVGPGLDRVAFMHTDDDNIIHILFRKLFPKLDQGKLVSFFNPTGTINKSD